ncbi:MAG: GGDEF domain-containing protein [Proteobacteria bacterium]|nr:GGDEF domain-containing protein [Pseudomonadota bacterium]
MKIINVTKQKFLIYLAYISLACFLTTLMNIVNTVYILKIPLTADTYIMPTLAGLLFGSMLAHIKSLSSRLKQLAFTDSLTKIYNRLHFAHFLDIEIDKAKRYDSTFSIIFFDLDHFKDVNDNFGHAAGDRVLEQLTQVVAKANRSADIFARHGGEEFIILAPETDISGAMIHAERLRNDIEKFEFDTVDHITSSFGVTEFKKEDTLEMLMERADIALYMAKEYGRNRVEKA